MLQQNCAAIPEGNACPKRFNSIMWPDAGFSANRGMEDERRADPRAAHPPGQREAWSFVNANDYVLGGDPQRPVSQVLNSTHRVRLSERANARLERQGP